MATEILLIAEARIATVQLLEQVLAYLDENSQLRTRSRLLDELRPQDFTPETYPLIVRSFNSQAFGLTSLLRRHGAGYGYYLDDNFWLLDPDTEIGRLYAAKSQRRRLDAVVRNASLVIASTPLLRDYLRSRNRNVIQLDSFFDFSLIPELPPEPKARPFLRGGFAASPDRVVDLRPVIDEVIEVLDEYEQVEFEIIGVSKNQLPRHPRINSFPYQASYSAYVEFQRSRQWDFGLAPLGSALSNRYKTDNKFREYAAQGIPGIYQSAPPYGSVRDEETGLLAGASRSWRDAIERYVVDPDLRSRVRRDARIDAERRCSLENVAPQWLEFFEAATPIGGSALRIQRIHRALGFRVWWPIRAARRARLLVAFGMKQLREEGAPATSRRTARFLWRWLVR